MHFERISRRSGSEKIMAVAETKSHELGDLTLTDQALVLVVEAPEKPGKYWSPIIVPQRRQKWMR